MLAARSLAAHSPFFPKPKKTPFPNRGPGFAVKDICDLDGQTFDLTENIILTEPQVNNDQYESNKNCQVTITVPDKQISLQFEHFEVESTMLGSCIDWLKIGDHTFCGSADDAFFTHDVGFDRNQEYSTGEQTLAFHWYTDYMTTDQGFRVILKHKNDQSKPDFFDNSNGFQSRLTASKKHKEQ
ncbi:unnamed protein product [Oikopleura dioica]|uniref:CUB domain-containing protein n=1 Tax=Oikopleura dioica TaxID=34765 RepID=E4X2U5_OIKDI|nr:unnamed protein product [Oikopleura dioica]